MKIREVVVYSLVFMFIFSITGNMSSAYMNKSKMSIFALDETNKNPCCTVELSAKDYITKDDQYIDAVVLFNKEVLVDIKDLEITRIYSSLNGLAGKFPSGLYAYLESAWFVSVIDEDSYVQLCSEDEIIINDNITDYVEPTENDQLSWGVDWIDAERVWGGEEDATDVVLGNYAGENIKVGIIDSGIDYTHPDLDDNYVTGIDYVNNDNNPYDDEGHGTHVAGIVGAEDNDVPGIIGVAPKVSLYGIKVLDSSGKGSFSNIIAGIDWAIENDMDIINLSLGGPFGTTALKEATNRAWDAGVIVVAAAGNKGWYLDLFYYWWVCAPAKYDKSIAVANLEPEPSSTDPTSVTRHSSSCTGSSLDVSAPGTLILSTYPSNTYYEGTGTSMAAPMVAGTCALILSANPWFTPDDVRDILIATVEDLGDSGHDNKYGYGQINAWSAVEEANITTPTDTDSDGLYDMEELQLGTDPFDADTDGDGLSDGSEVDTYGTDPLCIDTDGDTMIDGWEITYSFDPLDSSDKLGDPDNDQLLNYEEFLACSNPHVADTDGDGLSDYQEYHVYYTNPLNVDTDGDGYTDYYEINPPFTYDPSDPNDINSIPTVGGGGGGGGLF